MKSLLIEITNNTPEINFNIENCILVMRGDSYPENAFSFYKPVVEWIEQFILSKPKKITLNVQLVYFNSSTSKTLYDLFDLLNDIKKYDTDVIINWFYDEKNFSALESGEEFQEEYDTLSFNLMHNIELMNLL